MCPMLNRRAGGLEVFVISFIHREGGLEASKNALQIIRRAGGFQKARASKLWLFHFMPASGKLIITIYCI